ncbi:glycosyltransferase, partial [Citrobacter freundii]
MNMISVCIPTYNGMFYIKEQIQSILKELGENDEIIISDDGSTDRTIEIINEISDARIKVFTNSLKSDAKFNYRTEYLLKKVSLNVQNALAHCKGEYIYLADQDDIWCEGRISHTLPALKEKKPTLIICDCTVIDEHKKVTQKSYFEYTPPSDSILRTLFKSSFHGCCMCFNRALLEKTFPFPEYSLGHDLWIGLSAMKFGVVKFNTLPLVLYRRHLSTVTMTGNKSKNTLGFKLKYRFMMLVEYLKAGKNK